MCSNLRISDGCMAHSSDLSIISMVRSNGHFEWSTGNNLSTYRPMASRWQGLHLASTQDSKLSHEIEVSGQPVHWDSTQSMKLHSIQKEATRRVNVLSNAKNIIGIAKLLYRKNQITQKMTNNRLIKQTAGKPKNVIYCCSGGTSC